MPLIPTRYKNLVFVLRLLAIALLLSACAGKNSRDGEGKFVPPGADTSELKRTNRVFTTITGIADRAVRVNALSAVELRGLKRKASASEAQIRRLYRRAPKQIALALEPFGYYQPTITPTLGFEGGKFLANFAVDLGPRTMIRTVSFKLDGPAELDLMKRPKVRCSGCCCSAAIWMQNWSSIAWMCRVRPSARMCF